MNRAVLSRNPSSARGRVATAMTVGILLASTLAGCGDPKAATKSNFKRALEKVFDGKCLVLNGGPTHYPLDIDVWPNGQLQLVTGAEQVQALIDAGLLTGARRVIQRPSLFGGPGQAVQVEHVDFTDLGRSKWQAGSGNPLDAQPPGFCGGHLEVTSVDSFTTPADLNGATVSNVTFTAEVTLEDWTENKAIRQAYAEELSRMSRSLTLPLVQTNDGWALSQQIGQGED